MRNIMRNVVWIASATLTLFAVSTTAARAQAVQTPDCTAAPYNVPAGLATSATTAAQDWAQMMCQQGLQSGTPDSNPPNNVSRLNDPTAPINAWPTVLTTPETSWRDAYVDTVLKWQWGGWTTYDDSNSHGTANVLCGSTTGVAAPNCTVAIEQATSGGGSTNGYGDYGPRETTSGGFPILGARPYPTGSALLGTLDGNGNPTVCTAPGCVATGTYTPIDLFTMKDGATKIKTSKDWWLKRRPEIWDLVQKEFYGYAYPKSVWPSITWAIGPVTTGTQAGTISCITPMTGTTCPNGTVADGKSYAYRQKTYTGTLNTASYPALRNKPTISMTCRFPANATGKVPTFISIGESDTDFQYTAPLGYGACGYSMGSLQPDSGGASTTSYLEGLVNQGNWRKPTDPGALVSWAWGISRMIDEFALDPDPIGPDTDKVAVEGHSRDGKATLVTAAYDDRVVAALPSCGGAGGTALLRRHFGENIESIIGNGEYYWLAGNLMNYAGPECQTNPNRGKAGCTPAYMPRATEDLDVDAHSVISLIAPRAVMTNGGTSGDSWQDPRGMYLSGALAGPVWQLLGWPGQVIPQDTVFTRNPTGYGTTSDESIGGTPPINVAFIDGTVGYRRHSQGHTDQPDWPVFVTFASKYLNDVRPVITAGQTFTMPASSNTVGIVSGIPGGAGSFKNWQIKGGTGANLFDIDPNSGTITISDRSLLNGSSSSYTLTLMTSDGVLPSHDAVITINPAPVVTGNIQLATTASFTKQSDGSFLGSIKVSNVGTGTAENVVLTSATLGAGSGTPAPQALISIPPGGVAITTLSFPASAGTSGATVMERITGTYTGGTFGGNVRAVLP
jgi:hypothetical protein